MFITLVHVSLCLPSFLCDTKYLCLVSSEESLLSALVLFFFVCCVAFCLIVILPFLCAFRSCFLFGCPLFLSLFLYLALTKYLSISFLSVSSPFLCIPCTRFFLSRFRSVVNQGQGSCILFFSHAFHSPQSSVLPIRPLFSPITSQFLQFAFKTTHWSQYCRYGAASCATSSGQSVAYKRVCVSTNSDCNQVLCTLGIPKYDCSP